MTRPRKELISLSNTPYYHISSRCVRRAFLCGIDSYTQRSYEHRRQWIEDRLRLLSSLFAIDIAAYAIMSNHYHLVIKLDPTQANTWSDQDVITRWTHLFKGPLLVQRQQQGQALSVAEKNTINDIVTVWRQRLTDLSWFMKCLNETIAREANKEDNCTGHFWESRYQSQALLTEEALLSCMAYVDLNPIRATMAETPEASDYTSIQARIQQKPPSSPPSESTSIPIKPLLPFDGDLKDTLQIGIPFHLNEYLILVDWTGRIIRDDKRGYIAHTSPPILERLNIGTTDWIKSSSQFEQHYRKGAKKNGASLEK